MNGFTLPAPKIQGQVARWADNGAINLDKTGLRSPFSSDNWIIYHFEGDKDIAHNFNRSIHEVKEKYQIDLGDGVLINLHRNIRIKPEEIINEIKEMKKMD